MSPSARSAFLGYGTAVFGTALTLLLRIWMDPWLGDDAPLILFFIPVFAAALIGGFGAGLLATGLSAAAGDYFFIEPRHTWLWNHHAGDLRLLIFALQCVAFAGVAHQLRRARGRLEQALRQLETKKARLATVLEQMPAGVVIADSAAGRLLSGNRRAAEILGQTAPLPQNLDECGEWDFFHPGDGRRYLRSEYPIVRSLEGGETVSGEDVEFVRSDGSRGLMTVNSAPIRNGDGMVSGSVAVFDDITERRRLERELREGDRRYRQLVESSPDVIYTLSGADGTISELNPAFERITGWNPSDWLGKPFGELVHPDDRPLAIETFKQACGGHTVPPYELRIRAKSGEYLTGEFHSGPRIEGGRVVGEMGIVRDITDRKRAEERLRESEEQYRLLVESADQHAMVMTDCEGNVVSWSTGAERLFGWNEKEMLGQSICRIFTPEDQAACVAEREFAKAHANGRAEDRRWHIRKDGARLWANGVMTPVDDGRGGIRGFAKVMRDDTDRKRAEEERQRILEEAEAANRAKDEFLATLSHELRNPLNTIVGWVNLLKRGGLSEAESVQGLDIIDRSARTQVQLIRDLLDVSRIITGKLHLDVRPTDLAAVVRLALESVRFAAEAKGVRLETDFAVPVFPISGDPDRLQQAVWNLLSNAVKFTPAGGCVSVRLARVNNHVEILVSDTGKGMSADFLPHAFERFRQADHSSSRLHAGLGLGLAIVRHIVEHHGGAVAADSAGEGKGSTFTINLPVQAVVSVPIEPPLPAPREGDKPADGPPADIRGVRVLVVEDEPDGRDMIASLLKRSGAQVAVAGSVAEAIETLPRFAPDVLLSDIGMPGEDGYSLIRRVRRLPSERGGCVPAAALTAYVGERDRRDVLSAGFQEHVAKPVEPTQLQSVVARLAGRA